jgi:hypothetical protein
MPDPTTQLAVRQVSSSLTLNNALAGLRHTIEAAAREALEAQIDLADLTQSELTAAVKVQALKMVNGLDLTAVFVRYELLREIRDRSLFSIHPEGYNTLEQMAKAQGISSSELSNIIDLCEVVFPYVTERLEMHVGELWEEIGKSKMREIVPILKSLITGENSTSPEVRATVQQMLENVAAGAEVRGENLTAAEARRQAVEQVIEHGRHLTNRQLRRQLRPDGTPPITPSVLQLEDRRFVIMSLDEDQWIMLNRLLSDRLEPTVLALPRDPIQRQREAFRLPELRALLDLIQ